MAVATAQNIYDTANTQQVCELITNSGKESFNVILAPVCCPDKKVLNFLEEMTEVSIEAKYELTTKDVDGQDWKTVVEDGKHKMMVEISAKNKLNKTNAYLEYVKDGFLSGKKFSNLLNQNSMWWVRTIEKQLSAATYELDYIEVYKFLNGFTMVEQDGNYYKQEANEYKLTYVRGGSDEDVQKNVYGYKDIEKLTGFDPTTFVVNGQIATDNSNFEITSIANFEVLEPTCEVIYYTSEMTLLTNATQTNIAIDQIDGSVDQTTLVVPANARYIQVIATLDKKLCGNEILTQTLLKKDLYPNKKLFEKIN